ncbi:hypothetical protein [Rhizobium sp. P44RR-XXIV]|uniref:hypothetical protein n=1 Tax=Rhizobium sp. P44RR-XXIV TaxID=1921145 RepID=UPI000987634A|nr:hypothetical protein [Rhizobium sp. P44RR-XXIV]TIX91895.1 hypothetical protein BSK43_005645 [Rhizobium sp. P44RR-XXIV]
MGIQTKRAGDPCAQVGISLFKIAKANFAAPFAPGSLAFDSHNPELLAQFCVSEGWTGELSSGIIRLGQWSTMLHGLSSSECGLLSLMHSYDAQDRVRILDLFEQAATATSSFCYSTMTLGTNGHRQPIFCVGESIAAEGKHAGSMAGVFLFPRFKLEPGSQLATRQ